MRMRRNCSLARRVASCAARRCGLFRRCVGELDAFLLAFDEASDYDSPNFLWFRERYPRFAYVDRIAVALMRGAGALRAGSTGDFSSRRPPTATR